MVPEMKMYYRFKDGLNVELICYANNKCAAEKAMFNTYRRSSSDIASSAGGRPTPGVAYVTFDGRKFH